MRVWIDQDLCTGDGLCTDHAPELFVLGDDGISYVIGPDGLPCNSPGGAADPAPVREQLVDAAIAAAEDCPGECIFLEASPPDAPVTAWWRRTVADPSNHDLDDEPAPPALRAPSSGPGSWPRKVTVRWNRPRP